MIENIKAQIEILKIKLTFFVGIISGAIYTLFNIYRFFTSEKNLIAIDVFLALLIVYVTNSIIVNLVELNKKSRS